MIKGSINALQSFGTVDGPGIRYVVFLQGCPLSCPYCHNPEAKPLTGGELLTADELLLKILPCKPYFGSEGGVTVSGGEPLLQPEFVSELFTLLKSHGIHTALDTSGCILTEETKKAVLLTDLVLLDIKMTTEEQYQTHIGVSLYTVLSFLDFLEEHEKPVWIRYVAVPGLNDSVSEIKKLKEVTSGYRCIEKTELLPFRKLCLEKYEELSLPFPLKSTPAMTEEQVEELRKLLGRDD